MTFLDRFLQKSRSKKAMPYIPAQSAVLDIGCHRGELFVELGDSLGYGVGIDPTLEKDIVHQKYKLLKDAFPSKRLEGELYHCITMLAVLEHIASDLQPETINACNSLLRKGGLVIITVPDKKVDKILEVLQGLHLIEGMQAHQHYGFDISQVPGLFDNAGFILIAHKKFQLGLNNLFVFKKS